MALCDHTEQLSIPSYFIYHKR